MVEESQRKKTKFKKGKMKKLGPKPKSVKGKMRKLGKAKKP